MRLSKKLATSIAIVGAMAVLAPGTAHAATAAATTVVTGSGTISPGLTPTTGSPQSVTFTGTAAGAFVTDTPDVDAGQMSCSFSGGSGVTTLGMGMFVNETSLYGEGTVSGSCTGVGVLGSVVTISCTFDYLRLGGIVVIEGTCTATVDGVTFTASAAGTFVFVPTTASPTTSYALAGVAAGATAP